MSSYSLLLTCWFTSVPVHYSVVSILLLVSHLRCLISVHHVVNKSKNGCLYYISILTWSFFKIVKSSCIRDACLSLSALCLVQVEFLSFQTLVWCHSLGMCIITLIINQLLSFDWCKLSTIPSFLVLSHITICIVNHSILWLCIEYRFIPQCFANLLAISFNDYPHQILMISIHQSNDLCIFYVVDIMFPSLKFLFL